jgi:hypothetical protein
VIVISGALVVVALVLLVIGLVIAGLGWVYASIGVSLASFVFLVIGILQRRKEGPAAEGAPAQAGSGPLAAGVGAVARALSKDDDATVTTLPGAYTPPPAPTAEVATATGGQVLVVAGRPRYHVEGCRYLTGKDAESVDVAEARAQGFTACGVCKPDANLTAAPAPIAEASTAVEFTEPTASSAADNVEAAATEEPVEEEVTTAVAAPARKAAPARARTAAAKAAPA